MRGPERRRLGAWLARAAAFLFLLGLTTDLRAQQNQPTRLSLDEAIALARRNNPDFQAQKNDAEVADWAVREAYGNLLPGVSLSTGLSYQASGTPRFGIFNASDLGIANTPAYYSSDFSVSLNYSLSGASLLGPRREKANRVATEANILASDFVLKAVVTNQYLAVLRAQDGVTLSQEELKRADENLKLAQAKVAVGAAIPLESKQAEVERGRAEVNLLQARSIVQTERYRFMQQVGVELSPDIELTTKFSVFDLGLTQQELVTFAMNSHPQLVSLRATERASDASVKIARSAYLPSLDASAGLSGYTRQAGSTDAELIEQARRSVESQRASCEQMNRISSGLNTPLPGFPQNCSALVLTPDQERAVLSNNDVFPFDFTRQPWSAQLRISLPVFQGFGRELNVEAAKANAADVRHRLRGEELRLKTDIAAAYLNAVTARQSVALELRNSELANEQLGLARERYRLGAASYIELQEAETLKARADRAYLIVLYTFHEAVAALETAVGRNLRPAGETR